MKSGPLPGHGAEVLVAKNFVHFNSIYKMENYKTLRMPELKVLVRECRLKNYSRMRKAELMAFLRDDEQRLQRPISPPPQR